MLNMSRWQRISVCLLVCFCLFDWLDSTYVNHMPLSEPWNGYDLRAIDQDFRAWTQGIRCCEKEEKARQPSRWSGVSQNKVNALVRRCSCMTLLCCLCKAGKTKENHKRGEAAALGIHEAPQPQHPSHPPHTTHTSTHPHIHIPTHPCCQTRWSWVYWSRLGCQLSHGPCSTETLEIRHWDFWQSKDLKWLSVGMH